ncbi:MAG: response regulator transcription factor [bacterium]
MSRILVVEDNADLAYGLRNNLEIEGYEVDVVSDGPTALAEARRGRCHVVVLDVMLPGMDGFEVLRRLRAEGFALPVLLLTARGEEMDRVRGLKLGADDYVTKPFSLLELIARVQALLRRVSPRADRDPEDAWEGYGPVQFNRGTRCVRVGGRPVELSPKELDLLLELYDRRGAAVSRAELLQRVWGHPATLPSRTVDTHVAELRRKLEGGADSTEHILTVRKIGYRLKR